MKRNMSPEEFRQVSAEAEIIDVRSPEEYAEGHIQGARNISITGPEFMDEVGRLDREKPYALYCRSGNRSGTALQLMQQMGFTTVGHLASGLLDWQFELVQGREDEDPAAGREDEDPAAGREDESRSPTSNYTTAG
jgi:rhodanese-related sulfurtransferase